MTRNHRRTKATAILSAWMFAIAMHAAGQTLWGQDKPEPDVKNPPAAKPAKVGPSKPSKGRRKGIPRPTVALKPGEKPQAQFETPVYDFGRQRAGEKVKLDFWFKNVGTGPLEILKVKPGCSCTAGGEYDRIVQPNKRGRIPITFDTKKFTGPVTKTVTVYFNSPGELAKTTLKIKGDVWQPIEMKPRSIAFGRVPMESLDAEAPNKKLTLVNNMDVKITPSNLRSSDAAFVPTITMIEDGKKFELSVSVVKPVGLGSALGDIEFDTGLAETPTVKIRASVYVTAIVDVTPTELAVPAKRKNDLRRSFYVRNNSTEKVSLSDVKTSHPAITATITEARAGKSFRVTVLIPAAFEFNASGDWISINTSHPKMPKLTVPITRRAAAKPKART